MAVVQAFVVELARRMLPGQGQQARLVKGFDLVRGVGHGRQVGKADVALAHRLHALRQLSRALAHREQVPGRARGQVTVEAQPVAGAVVALTLPLPALGELEGEGGEVELELVDGAAQGDQEEAEIDLFVHKPILRTYVRIVHQNRVNLYCSPAAPRPPRPTPATPFTVRPSVPDLDSATHA